MDNNFFINKFQLNLDPEYASYFKRYKQDKDFFDTDEKIKYSLNSAMQYFQNRIKNPSIFGPELAFIGLPSYFYTSYPYSNFCEQVLLVYYKCCAPNWRIVKDKLCNFCQHANHDKNRYHNKNPELLAQHCLAQSL